ncbi:uncharacterized protein TNCV_3179421 [Trichonephila clavipes]|nr:uncharacterized protein TNCV_3179421 [Trichonephila clavipes]
MVSDGTEFAVGDVEKLFDETRRNTKAKYEEWAKYYKKTEARCSDPVVWKAGKRLTVNIDQVRLYHQGKHVVNEIGVGSSDSYGSRCQSNSFESVRPRSNELQYSRNNGSGERREE